MSATRTAATGPSNGRPDSVTANPAAVLAGSEAGTVASRRVTTQAPVAFWAILPDSKVSSVPPMSLLFLVMFVLLERRSALWRPGRSVQGATGRGLRGQFSVVGLGAGGAGP